jgi:hypothetical protein
LAAVAALAIGTLGFVMTAGPAAAATTGTITGTVTAAAGGAPIAGVCVSASQQGGSSSFTATTGSTGTYSIPGLAPGAYEVEFGGCAPLPGNYLVQWYVGASSPATATPVTVAAGRTKGKINAALAAGGEITGTAQDVHSGAPIAGICVSATSGGLSGGPVGSATTATDGTYLIEGLPSGSYLVSFGCSAVYLEQWYDDQSSPATATAVPVVAGSTTPNIDAQLIKGGSVKGTVTDAATNKGLGHICVAVTGDGTSATEASLTSSSGAYSLGGLTPGYYTVQFDVPSACGPSTPTTRYVTQWWQDATSGSAATPILVNEGTATKSIDAALVVGGTISGKVTAGGVAVPGECVGAEPAASSFSGTQGAAITGTTGTYAITGLPAGNYLVVFSPCTPSTSQYMTQWYKGQPTPGTAKILSVALGQTVGRINAALTTGGSVSGVVTAAAGGVGLGGVCVQISDTAGAIASAVTSSDGSYTVSGLATGTYFVEFAPPGCSFVPYLPQWYQGQSSYLTANPVAVQAGQALTGIGAALTAGGTITGTVTAASGGAPLAGVCVQISPVSNSGIFFSFGTTTGSGGTYAVTGLPSGYYLVQFIPSCGVSGSFATEWYDNQFSEQMATPVLVTAPNITSGIDQALLA